MSSKDLGTGLDLPRRPKDKLSAGIDVTPAKGLDLGLRLTVVGRRTDTDFTAWPAALVSLPSYALLDATISCDVGRGVELFLRADNILDRRYEMVYGYGSPGFGAHVGFRLAFDPSREPSCPPFGKGAGDACRLQFRASRPLGSRYEDCRGNPSIGFPNSLRRRSKGPVA